MTQTDLTDTPWNLEKSHLSENWLKGFRKALAFARWNEAMALALIPFHPMHHQLSSILSQDTQENEAIEPPSEEKVLERWRTALGLSLDLAKQLIETEDSIACTVLPSIKPLALFTGAEAEASERLLAIENELRTPEAPSWNETPSWRKRMREERASDCRRIAEALQRTASEQDSGDLADLLLKAFNSADCHCPWGCQQV